MSEEENGKFKSQEEIVSERQEAFRARAKEFEAELVALQDKHEVGVAPVVRFSKQGIAPIIEMVDLRKYPEESIEVAHAA